jgi:hypothetical protein
VHFCKNENKWSSFPRHIRKFVRFFHYSSSSDASCTPTPKFIDFLNDRRGEGFLMFAPKPVTESWRPRDGVREFWPEGGGVARLLKIDVKSGTAPRFVFSTSSLCFCDVDMRGRTSLAWVGIGARSIGLDAVRNIRTVLSVHTLAKLTDVFVQDLLPRLQNF